MTGNTSTARLSYILGNRAEERKSEIEAGPKPDIASTQLSEPERESGGVGLGVPAQTLYTCRPESPTEPLGTPALDEIPARFCCTGFEYSRRAGSRAEERDGSQP